MFRSVNTLFPHLSIIELIRGSEWMMFQLSSLPQFPQFRDFSVSTSDPSVEDSTLEIDRDGNVDEALQLRIIPVWYHPSYTSSYWMWYKGRYITISRTMEETRLVLGKINTGNHVSVLGFYRLPNP